MSAFPRRGRVRVLALQQVLPEVRSTYLVKFAFLGVRAMGDSIFTTANLGLSFDFYTVAESQVCAKFTKFNYPLHVSSGLGSEGTFRSNKYVD